MIDLVRKSSGVIIGVVSDENDFAADLRARSDAVRFDLNADLRVGGVISTSGLSSSIRGALWNILKSNSSISLSDTDSG